MSDASSVSESALDEHLQEMGFDTTEISTLPIDMKRDISSKDGKKVAAQELDTTVTVTDEEGNTVTDRAAINQLAASSNPNISGYAVYSGTSNNGRERIYQVYATYRWASSPFNFYTDNLQ